MRVVLLSPYGDCAGTKWMSRHQAGPLKHARSMSSRHGPERCFSEEFYFSTVQFPRSGSPRSRWREVPQSREIPSRIDWLNESLSSPVLTVRRRVSETNPFRRPRLFCSQRFPWPSHFSSSDIARAVFITEAFSGLHAVLSHTIDDHLFASINDRENGSMSGLILLRIQFAAEH
ncbi:hypothetical protein A0H81_09672 [Grifola frondosa]|uniref:Uncharacterized protein n=1 Tax=Grifola frondosa TaxID=5627 RepID=A0A1C7LZP9_GRIFR|nr:hypothetical protein A0H81_09672 [Grifola frondosa]